MPTTRLAHGRSWRPPSRRPERCRRSDLRHRVALDVGVTLGHEHFEGRTLNAGRQGILVAMAVAPASRQLLRVHIALPDGRSVSVHGMVVHVVEARSGRPGAVGIQFYAVSPAQASTWEVFLATLPAAAVIVRGDTEGQGDEIETLDDELVLDAI